MHFWLCGCGACSMEAEAVPRHCQAAVQSERGQNALLARVGLAPDKACARLCRDGTGLPKGAAPWPPFGSTPDSSIHARAWAGSASGHGELHGKQLWHGSEDELCFLHVLRRAKGHSLGSGKSIREVSTLRRIVPHSRTLSWHNET